VSRSHLTRPRRRPIAALVSAVLVGAMIYASGGPAGAAPAGPAGAGAAPLAAAAGRSSLLGRPVDPPVWSKEKAAPVEPGRAGTARRLPSSGRLGALVELTTPSTVTAYRVAAPRGRAAAAAAARSQYAQVRSAQARVVAALPAVAPGARVLYRTHSLLAGVAVYTDAKSLPRLQRLPGVKAVYPISPKALANSYAVPLQHAPEAWTAYGDLGQDSTVAVIDTGIDYTHADFGGPGTAAAYQAAFARGALPADPALFPSAKIIGGTDLVGDAYDPTSDDPNKFTPHPDPNPLDCDGHGTHVAGTAAGFGVDSTGQRFDGPYNTGTPFGSLRIGPGMAPKARLYAFRVFGCAGPSDVVGAAIDKATDPNGDGDPSDHADVINMSLGADFGSPDDADSVATNRATGFGITVVVASGNAGDIYDAGGSPGNAVTAIAAANTVDALSKLDHVHVSAPAGIAGDYGATRAVAYDWATKPDLAGPVVAPSNSANKDGCDPLTGETALNGKVAFLEWTDNDPARRCGSAARAANVQAVGGIGFVLADDAETFEAGILGSAAIPGVLVIKSAGDTMRAALGSGLAVNGTGAADITQLIPANDDKVNGSSSRGIRRNGNVKPDVGAVGTSVFSAAVGTGNQGLSETGTSMATPMVAGEAALVKSKHPDWTPQEIKADIMNTAGQDLFTGDNHTGDRYAPNRVGAGRIDAKSALDNTVLAYVLDNPGAVSVSFGPVAVTGPTTLRKTIKVVNKAIDAATYTLSYDALTTVPGVSYRVASSQADTSKVTIAGRSSALVTVSLVVTDRTQLTKTIDPTMSRTDTIGPGPQDTVARNYLADASGRVLLTPVSGSAPTLRVPVYSAPRPASTMTQPGTVNLPAGTITNVALPLSGTDVSQGTGDTLVRSAVAGFELQATSGLQRLCTATVTFLCVRLPEERSADIRYVGATTDAPQHPGHPLDGLAYFAVSTHGPWQTPASKQFFDVRIDTNNDNVPDVDLYNTRLTGTDIFVSALFDSNTGKVLDIEPMNGVLGNVDTAEFDSDTMVLPVAIAALPGVGAAHPRIRYGVGSFSAFSLYPIDLAGLAPDGTLSHPLSVDLFRPGITVTAGNNGILYQDLPNTSLTLRRDTPAYQADHGLGVLMAHFHNRVGTKAQVVHLRVAPTVSLRLSTTRVAFGQRVDSRVSVANTNNAVPTGSVQVRRAGPVVLVSGKLVNGTFGTRLPNLPRGTWTIYAYYGGDANYLGGNSNSVRLVVF
jgi:subtilisin family serine protease